MFFNQEYDKSLWFILKNDKKNRKRILEFIHSFPSSLHKELLEKINTNAKKNISKELIIDGIVHYYEFNIVDGSLTVGSYSRKNSSEEDIFIFKLYPYKNVDFYTKEVIIGSIIYQSKYFDNQSAYDCDKVKYCLEKNKFGCYFVCNHEYGLFFNKIRTRVFLDNISSCLNLETFDAKKNLRVRRKAKDIKES